MGSVIKKPGGIELKYSETVQPNVKKVLKLVGGYGKNVILRPSTPPVIVYQTPNGFDAKAFMEFLSGLRLHKKR